MLRISGVVNDSVRPMLRNKSGITQRGGLSDPVLLPGLLSPCHPAPRSSRFQVMPERHQSRKTKMPPAGVLGMDIALPFVLKSMLENQLKVCSLFGCFLWLFGVHFDYF